MTELRPEETDRSQDPGDDELVARAVRGDGVALEILLVRHQGLVYRYLLARVRDEAEAQDLTQESLVKALRSLEGFRGDAPFRSWLLAVARNEFRSWARTRARRWTVSLEVVPDVSSREEGAEEAVAREGEVDRVRGALARLPEKQRLSVSLRLFDGLSFREVGKHTDSSEGAARVNYHHGIRKLREWLEEGEEEESRKGGVEP